MSGGGSSDCVNIDFSNQSINQIDFDDNEDGILMFERTEDDVDEETNNEDGFLSSKMQKILHNQKMTSIKKWIMKMAS